MNTILGKGEVSSEGTGPTANTLRKAEGIGLPPDLREKNLINRMRWNAHITAADLAWHRTFETNPKLAHMLGITDDGKGNKYETNLDEVHSDPVKMAPYMMDDIGYGRHLSTNRRGEDWVEEVLREVELPRRANSTNLEKWTSVANSMTLGPWTAARDVFGSAAIMSSWMKPHEYKALLGALKSTVTGAAKATAKGQVRQQRTSEFFAQEDAYRGAALRFADFMRKYQGRDAIERGLRLFISEVGNLIAPDRVSSALKGNTSDIRFMEEMGGKNWKNEAFDPTKYQNLLDRIGQRFVETVQGSYSVDYLPSWLSRADKGTLKGLLTLSRWSIERANRFQNEVVKPMAEDGNVRPLLKQMFGYALSAAGLDYLGEIILDKKPRELTFPEWFKLDTKDKQEEFGYTMASKLSLMGFGGIFSQLVNDYYSIKHGEGMFSPVNNPALRLSEDTVRKLIGYVEGYGGPLDASFWKNLASIPIETLADEIQLVRMARSGLGNREETGVREERILDRILGNTRMGLKTIEDPNPFSPVRKLKQADTPEEIQSLEGQMYDYYSRNRLKAPSIMPSNLERRAMKGYYNFVRDIQGEDKAGRQFEFDRKQAALAEMRKAITARAWYGAEANRLLHR